MQRGKLVKWNDDRGFGFIQPNDQSQEVFLHISDVDRPVRTPRVGDIIFYHTTPGKNGKPRACLAKIQGVAAKSLPEFTSISATLLLKVTLLSLLPIIGSIHFAITQRNLIPLSLYLGMSGIAFIFYHEDKFRAQQRRWRISESTLHLLEWLGGWIGAYVAQHLLRHKNIKPSYQLEFRTIVAVHLVGWMAWLVLNAR